ncbi:MAG: DUF3332 family protein [Candidatus Omnitrophota bacterium]|nr:DUF3332 family protein [Candidatus Omnitrophota bacterium]MDZ4243429.1 DUF3332 family protein [Candidatus Omnitrophota bacterium]
MKKAILGVMIAAFLVTGCTGSFNLTRKVYNFHRSQQPDKWMDELCFLVVTLIPVYSIATFADAIIFNSIEFWTGENPVDMADAKTVTQGREEVVISYDKATDQITVLPKANGQEKQALVLERLDDHRVAVKDQAGTVLYVSAKGPEGDISVYDKDNKLVKNYSAKDVAIMKETLSKN